MKEEVIERVVKYIVIEIFDFGKDIVMKGKRNWLDFKFIVWNKEVYVFLECYFLFIVIYGLKLYNKICRKEEFVYLWII